MARANGMTQPGAKGGQQGRRGGRANIQARHQIRRGPLFRGTGLRRSR